MVMYKFVADYQINTSRRTIYPYLSTASGLSQWFADDVTINEDKVYNFIYDGEDHFAKAVVMRNNHNVKFEFFEPGSQDEDKEKAYIEFRLDENELTQTFFLRVTDYSDVYDEEEQMSIWEGLIGTLREIIGG